MAVAAPARRSRAVPAPTPSRTTAPPKRKVPARKPTRSRAVTAPARKPAVKRAPAARPKLAVVAGRTAVAVRQLPDSSLVVRMTQGRLWIAVLGVLLVGIVSLNVATLSVAASQGKIDEQITALEKENSMLGAREAEHFSTERVRGEATQLGLAMPTTEEPKLIQAGPGDTATAAARLAAAGG
ncbi:MAG: hypothetical protein ACTHKT_13435 [Solirubrobacterales bacterium]